jgi:hypothetical protein
VIMMDVGGRLHLVVLRTSLGYRAILFTDACPAALLYSLVDTYVDLCRRLYVTSSRNLKNGLRHCQT